MTEYSSSAARPVCSVCIANYNGAEVISECLDSVLTQDCSFSIEIIVHDDASTDGSAAIIRDRYPGVRLITSERNVGFCTSNNRLVAVAHGEFVLLLNNDATLFPDALQTLHDEAINSPPAILGLPQYDMRTGELIDIGSLCDPFLNPIPNKDPDRGNVAMVSGACLWIPKALWQELGGFPDFFHSVAEDMYLACAARLRAYPVEAIPRSGFKHHIGKTLGGGGVKDRRLSSTLRRRALSERNKSYVIVLCYPTPLFQLLFPLHIATLIAEGLLLSIIKTDITIFRDIYWASLKSVWVEWKKLTILRKSIQAARTQTLRNWLTVFTPKLHKLSLLVRYGIPHISTSSHHRNNVQ